MIELAFNELSLDTHVNNKSHASSVFDTLFDICNAVSDLKLVPVRLRTKKDFKLTSLKGIHFTLEDYLGFFSDDKRSRYLGYLTQKPLLSDNPYYSFGNVEVTGFGYAFETDNVSVSVNNPDNWKEVSYSITRDFLPSDDGEVMSTECTVIHLPHVNSVEDMLPAIKKGILDNAKLNLPDIENIPDFWNKRSNLFAMLDFSSETEELLLKFESVHNPDFIKTALYFERLNNHLLKVKLQQANFGQIPGDKGNDGEATLNQYADERTFTISDGVKKVFSLHVRLGGNLRIYLYPDETHGKYIVGHVGHHLRTKNFRK